jgi:hypothetical protein
MDAKSYQSLAEAQLSQTEELVDRKERLIFCRKPYPTNGARSGKTIESWD